MTSETDDRVVHALGALADEAQPSAELRARSLTIRPPRRRWPVAIAGAALVVAVALTAAVLAIADGDPAEVVVVDDDRPAPEPTMSPTTTVDLVPVEHGDPIDPAAVGPDLLVFDDDGVAIVGADRARVVSTRPVIDAHPDGAGGVVLQERTEWRSIVWLPDGDTPVILVDDDSNALLRGVTDGPDGPVALVTQRPGTGEEAIESLYRIPLEPGAEPELITATGGYESGLDALATGAAGRMYLSTCHLQCSISVGTNDDPPIVPADWMSGLDVEGDTMAFIRFEIDSSLGRMIGPVLVLSSLDGGTQRHFALGEAVGDRADVDLADDGRSAIVSFTSHVDASSPPQVVDRLDEDTARVRSLTSSVRARFADQSLFDDEAA